jgi:AraC-like DNA-binding protein
VGDFSLLVNLGARIELGGARERLRLDSDELALWQHSTRPGGVPVSALRCEANTGAWVALWMASFSAAANREDSCAPPCVVRLDAQTLRESHAIQRILDLLRLELEGARARDAHVARGLMDVLLAYVLRARAAGGGAAPHLPEDASVARVLEVMRARPNERWTLAALAKIAGLSRAQFVRRFTAFVGVAPLRYLCETRLQLAMELLANGDDSLAVIAERVGYESEFAFSRAFKRFAGEAPAFFRRRLRSGHGPILALAA